MPYYLFSSVGKVLCFNIVLSTTSEWKAMFFIPTLVEHMYIPVMSDPRTKYFVNQGILLHLYRLTFFNLNLALSALTYSSVLLISTSRMSLADCNSFWKVQLYLLRLVILFLWQQVVRMAYISAAVLYFRNHWSSELWTCRSHNFGLSNTLIACHVHFPSCCSCIVERY